MRKIVSVSGCALVLALAFAGCGGTAGSGFGGSGGSGGSGGGGFGGGGSAGSPDLGDSGSDGNGPTATTIYADTDSALYSVDPATKAVSLIGDFQGLDNGDVTTDLAVDASGNIYVNSETAVYKVTLPSGGSGPVPVTKIANISTRSGQSFYALAFAPSGVLGSGETLVGGDGNGEVWAIDTTTGAIQDLGNFGPAPGGYHSVFGVSGDIVFYTNGGTATGLATIRSCDSSGSCNENDDYLAAIDMNALVTAYTSHTPATSLLYGIYGGSGGSAGPGTGYGRLFGLGAWEGQVYAFARVGSYGSPPPRVVLIDTTNGAGSVVATSTAFTSGGWSGAGVTTSAQITVAPPPK